MNKHFRRMALLLSLCLLLGGCAQIMPDPVRDAASTLAPEVEDALPQVEAPLSASVSREVTLYFRYGDQPYLAPEVRTISVPPDQSLEWTLLQELAKGPGSRSTQLTGTLPEGCAILSAAGQGRTLFVTLSSNILKGWADEPADWAQDAYWQTEAPFRRQLCMQSIVATVTENCEYDSVQMLVEQTDVVSDSLRLHQSWFLDGSDDTQLMEPISRQDSYLLTPANTLRALLDAWRLRDAALLRSYTADAPDTETFAAALSDAPMLVSFGFSGGTISPDGQTVHLTLRLCCQDSAGITGEIGGLMVHMTRVGGLWKLPWTQLEALFSMLA